VGDLISYPPEPRPWANKIVAIVSNGKAFYLHFILNKAILLKWTHRLNMNALKIMCTKMEHLVFFLACPSSVLSAKAARGVRFNSLQNVLLSLLQ